MALVFAAAFQGVEELTCDLDRLVLLSSNDGCAGGGGCAGFFSPIPHAGTVVFFPSLLFSTRDPADCNNLSCAVLGVPNGANAPVVVELELPSALLFVVVVLVLLLVEFSFDDLVDNNNNPLRLDDDPLNNDELLPTPVLETNGTGGAAGALVKLLRLLPNFL